MARTSNPAPGELLVEVRAQAAHPGGEDHETTAAAMVRLLTRRGHTVDIAHSVKTALEIAGQHRFDVVLSDLGLPDGNGFQLMEQLRERHHLRGIALSGYGMESTRRKVSAPVSTRT